ncbi:MAG: molybdopterin molybdotransferase MoeA [Nitrospirae bacterium]|nr:molybdopterin molybdotransferase MoeA [Nitrospirota bacterium]
MLGRIEAVSVKKALSLLDSIELVTLPVLDVHILDGCGRIIAEEITADEDLPGFPKSTMDGYAVNAKDTFGASETIPQFLKLFGQDVFMGEQPDFSLAPGTAAKIPTGGMLPPGSDAVVMLEHTNAIDDAMVEITRAVAPGDNVIQPGEDVRAGEKLFPAGHRLRPQDVGCLAGCGKTSVPVYEKPIVSIISTGNEIVAPELPLPKGKVRDINSYNLHALVLGAGAVPAIKGIFKDDFRCLKEAVEESLVSSHMVLISGGSSVGTMDYTERIINTLGAPGVIFHGVAVKPGKPLIAGVAGGKPVFGLPGHPAAVYASFKIFVERVLRRLAGQRIPYECPWQNPQIKARLTKNLSSVPGRVDYVWVKLSLEDGAVLAEAVLGKSGLITTLAIADGYITVDEDRRGIPAGEEVNVRLFS